MVRLRVTSQITWAIIMTPWFPMYYLRRTGRCMEEEWIEETLSVVTDPPRAERIAYGGGFLEERKDKVNNRTRKRRECFWSVVIFFLFPNTFLLQKLMHLQVSKPNKRTEIYPDHFSAHDLLIFFPIGSSGGEQAKHSQIFLCKKKPASDWK